MPQKCPCPCTNPLAPTVYPLQGGKVHPNFENKKNFSEKKFVSLHYDQKNTLNPLVKSVFKSVHNYGRYLQFCDRRVCNAASTTRRVGRYFALGNTCPVQLFLVIIIIIIIVLCLALLYQAIVFALTLTLYLVTLIPSLIVWRNKQETEWKYKGSENISAYCYTTWRIKLTLYSLLISCENFWIRIMIRIANKIYSIVPWATPHLFKTFHQHPFITFWVIYRTDRQTDWHR